MTKSTQQGAEQKRGPLTCEWCGRDLLDMVDGVIVKIQERRGFMPRPRYVEVYSWCNLPCQEEALLALGLDRWTTHCKSIDDAANPLDYPRWSAETSQQIARGDFWPAAAEKLAEAKRKIATVADRKPTAEDEARYQLIRLMNGF